MKDICVNYCSITVLSSKDIYVYGVKSIPLIDNKLDSTCAKMTSIILQEVSVKPSGVIKER